MTSECFAGTTPTSPSRRLFLAAAVLLLTGCSPAEPPPTLPKLNIDTARVSVSGISSGAYMAQQMHLAFSDRLIGAALLAGGPYGCAQGDLQTALGQCMAPSVEQQPDLRQLAAAARERAEGGQLAGLEGLSGDRVWVFHGTHDQTVSAAITAASAQIYRELNPGVELTEIFDLAVAHLMPLDGDGGACAVSEPPFMAACGFDAAGEALRHLHGAATAVPDTPSGRLMAFDAGALADGEPPGDSRGYLYVPTACAEGAACGLHIAFHGCQQSVGDLGDRFAASAGYNRWADALRLVVLYPQARASMLPLNPKACWDWWGYTGPDYDTRSGAQLTWVAAMTARLGAPLTDAARH